MGKSAETFLDREIKNISISEFSSILCKVNEDTVCVLEKKMPFTVIGDEMVFSYKSYPLGKYKLAIQEGENIYPVDEKSLKYLGELLDCKISFKEYNAEIPIAMAISIANNIPDDIKINIENGVITSFSKKEIYPDKKMVDNIVSDMKNMGFPLKGFKNNPDGDIFSFLKGEIEITIYNSRKLGRKSELILEVVNEDGEIKKLRFPKHSDRGKSFLSFKKEIDEVREYIK